MANETVNYGYPKPEEDDFYDINQFNQAMDMIDGDLKKTEEMKQNKLDIGAFTGNIDVLGEGGLPQTSSVSWCRSELVSGTLPVLSDAAYCFSLETCVAAENERDSARVQRVVLHETANIRILERMYVDGQWHEWKELLQKDGDLKDATVTFDSGDNESPAEWAEVAPVEGGEKQDSLWQKVSLFARNLRYLWKLCGTNDISGLADGTLTGAVSKLNTDLIGKSPIKIGTSETSFCNAAGGAGITSVFATLDSIHNRITGMESGFHNTTSAGPIFGILLQKSDSSGQGYSGLAFSYATMSIVYFAYIGGTFYIKIYG